MMFWGARPQSQQHIAKKGQARPDWSYRGARRNLARAAYWPIRYRWRVYMRRMKEALGLRLGVPTLPA